MEIFADQVDLVRNSCGQRESCQVEASPQTFGKKGECEGNY